MRMVTGGEPVDVQQVADGLVARLERLPFTLNFESETGGEGQEDLRLGVGEVLRFGGEGTAGKDTTDSGRSATLRGLRYGRPWSAAQRDETLAHGEKRTLSCELGGQM